LLWFNQFGSPSVSTIPYPSTKNQIVHIEKKPIRLSIKGNSKFIINKEPYDLLMDIVNLDKLMIYDLPDYLKHLEHSNLNTYIIPKTQYQGGSINNEKTYKIGKFTYTSKVHKIHDLIKKAIPLSVKNADTPIDVYLYMKFGNISVFNLSTKDGQNLLNKAYKEGYIRRI
jgi:hypothetical protein